MKVGFVIHRYGDGFAGGAEGLAKQMAEHMKAVWDVTVFTTCAQDYLTWANHFPEGESTINGVTVRRFPVIKPRDIKEFSQYSYATESKAFRISEEEERRYFEQQGPFTPALVQCLDQVKDQFDCFIFFTYLYYPTVMGLPKVASKSYLVATAHDESPFYFARTYAPLFHSLKGIIYLTEQERDLINRVYPVPGHVRQIKGGYGVKIPDALSSEQERRCHERFHRHTDAPFFLYLGRASESKRCQELVHAFATLSDDYQIPCRLIFAGGMDFVLPEGRSNIEYVGYLDEVEKTYLINRSLAIVNPSSTESLSIVLLEAWAHGKPVIVNGASEVMKDLCESSGGGLYYHSEAMFRGLLGWVYSHKKEAEELGYSGHHYVLQHFNWQSIIDRLRREIVS